MKIIYTQENNELFINVDWSEFNNTEDMINVVDKILPNRSKIVGNNLKIKGKFPYQLGMWIAIKYAQLGILIHVFDPQQRKFVLLNQVK